MRIVNREIVITQTQFLPGRGREGDREDGGIIPVTKRLLIYEAKRPHAVFKIVSILNVSNYIFFFFSPSGWTMIGSARLGTARPGPARPGPARRAPTRAIRHSARVISPFQRARVGARRRN